MGCTIMKSFYKELEEKREFFITQLNNKYAALEWAWFQEEISDEEWGRYLFFRENPKGTHFERWTHDHGCRRWFNVMRDTVTDQIIKTYKMGEAKPEISNE